MSEGTEPHLDDLRRDGMDDPNRPLSTAALDPERLLKLVRQALGQPGASRPLPIDVRLSDLGLSSVRLVNLILAIEAEFDVAISQGDITPENFNTIASIQVLLRTLIAAQTTALAST